MATWPAKINYATGDVLTAAQMNDIGGELNDLYNSYGKAAGKNAVINGGFDIWQRGTSVTPTTNSGNYLVDRWFSTRIYYTDYTVTRQATGDTTNLPNIQYCARVQHNNGATNVAASTMAITQSLESVNSIPFAGKTATLSFYVRVGSNFSGASNQMNVYLYSGTGTDQNVVSGFTGQSTVATTNFTPTTTWQRFTITGTVSATATQLGLTIGYAPVGTSGANDYFEVTGVQLELGSSATPFSRVGGTIQGELAACQRYYYRAGAGNVYGNYSSGIAYSTTNAYSPIKLPVTMRTIPATLDYSTLALFDGVTFTAVSSMTLSSNQNTPDTALIIPVVASGLTQYRPYFLVNNNNTAGYVGLSAEL